MNKTGFKNVVVIGGGVLGSQIAYQTAFKGFQTGIWLRSEASIERAKPKLARLHEIYRKELSELRAQLGTPGLRASRGLAADPASLSEAEADALLERADTAFQELRLSTDLAELVKDADLVIETLAEDPEQKTAFYRQLSPLLPEKTVLVTNSSTLLPSQFAGETGRPEKYLALHFANQIWKNNTAEIMGHPGTDPAVFEEIVHFAEEIGMVPLRLSKEQPGYILNSLLVPFLSAAEALLAKGVSDPATIDMTWRLGTGAPVGPFQILDVVGLTTAYNIVVMNPQAKDPESIPAKIAAILKEYIDAGKTGVNAGEGFYKYK